MFLNIATGVGQIVKIVWLVLSFLPMGYLRFIVDCWNSHPFWTIVLSPLILAGAFAVLYLEGVLLYLMGLAFAKLFEWLFVGLMAIGTAYNWLVYVFKKIVHWLVCVFKKIVHWIYMGTVGWIGLLYARLVYGKKQIGYYPDSWAVRQIYYLKNGQKNGPEKFYYHSGKINKIQTWQQGKKQGAFTIFYPSGEVYFFGQYKDDVLVQPIKVNYLEHSQRISLDLTQINRDYVNKQQQLCKNYQQEYEELTQVELDVIEDACDAYKGNWLIEVARWAYRLQVKYPKKVIKSVTGIKAYQDRKKAKQLVAICSPWYETACQTTQYHQRKMRKSINDLGKIRLEVLQGVVGEFLGCLKDMNQKNKINYYELLGKIGITPQVAKEFGDIDMSVSKLSSNTLLVGTLGTLTAASTPAAVTSAVAGWATASTGTAISSLSGAAATNATLAWLGGGSIASGGGGMAAGAATLTTATTMATAGVAIVAAGLMATVHYSNKLTKITEKAANMAVDIAKMEGSWVAMDAIVERANELTKATFEIQQKALAALERLKPLAPDFNTQEEYYNKTFRTTARLVEALIGLVKIALLDEVGNLNDMGLKEIAHTREIIKNTELVTYE